MTGFSFLLFLGLRISTLIPVQLITNKLTINPLQRNTASNPSIPIILHILGGGLRL